MTTSGILRGRAQTGHGQMSREDERFRSNDLGYCVAEVAGGEVAEKRERRVRDFTQYNKQSFTQYLVRVQAA